MAVVQTARAVLATGITTRFGQATVQVVCQTPCQRYQPITVTVVFEDARWFPLHELPDLPGKHSIARFILDHYARPEGAGGA